MVVHFTHLHYDVLSLTSIPLSCLLSVALSFDQPTGSYLPKYPTIISYSMKQTSPSRQYCLVFCKPTISTKQLCLQSIARYVYAHNAHKAAATSVGGILRTTDQKRFIRPLNVPTRTNFHCKLSSLSRTHSRQTTLNAREGSGETRNT